MRGSPLADNRVDEPQPTPGVPEPPETLDGEARAEWERIVPELAACNLLALVDRAALVLLCEAWADYVAARQIVELEGMVVSQEIKGKAVLLKHPAVLCMDSAYARWYKLSKDFGLTPSARAGLAIERKNPDENRGKSRFFKKGS